MENRNEAKMLNEKELETVNGGVDEFDEQKIVERGGKNYAKDILDVHHNRTLNGGGVYPSPLIPDRLINDMNGSAGAAAGTLQRNIPGDDSQPVQL